MKNSFITSVLLISLFFSFGCKKKEKTIEESASVSATTTSATTTGVSMAANTATWTYAGNTYSINPSYGSITWQSSATVSGQKILSGMDNLLGVPRHFLYFEFTSQLPSTGTYTLVDYNSIAALNNNQVKGSIAEYYSASATDKYGYTNAVGVNTISVINTNSLVSISFNNLVFSAIGNSTITPQTYTVSGGIAK